MADKDPAKAPVLEAVFGVFAVVGWLALLGLHLAWRGTFGWIFETLAGFLDRGIPIPRAPDVHPFGAVARWLRSLDRNVDGALVAGANALEGSAVWLFSRVGYFLGGLAGGIAGLALDVEHALWRFIRVRVPQLIRSALRAVWREIRKQAGAFRVFGKWVTNKVWTLVKALARQAIKDARDFLRFARWARSNVGKLWKPIHAILRRLNVLDKKFGALGFRSILTRGLKSLGLTYLLASNVIDVMKWVAKLDRGAVLEFLRDEILPLDFCKLAGYQYDLAVHVVEPAMQRLIGSQDWYCTLPGDTLPSAVVSHPGYDGAWQPTATPPLESPLTSTRLAPDVPLPRSIT